MWLRGLCFVAAVNVAFVQSQTPVFRAATDLVLVDFIAAADNGMPITDLRTDEITLKVNGQPREIKSLQFIRLASSETLTDDAKAADLPPLPFGSNLASDAGRVVILVFHHMSVSPGDELPTKMAALSFLDRLTPRDRVGVVTFPLGKVDMDLTTDHQRVREALPFVIARNRPPLPGFPDVPQGAARSCEDLQEFLRGIGGTEGPKTIVLVSGGMGDANVLCLRDVSKVAESVRARFYIIQPLTFVGAASSRDMPTQTIGAARKSEALEDLASLTGGEFVNPYGKVDPFFTRIARETAAYYLLGFEPTSSERNGKTQNISVQVKRTNMVVRARQEFAFPVAKRAPFAATPTPYTLLNDFNTHADYALRTAAYSFRGTTASTIRVVVAAEPLEDNAPSSMAAGLVDEKGHLVVTMNVEQSLLRSRPVVAHLNVREGPYRLRVAAASSNGRLGAADYEFRARLLKARGFGTSDLMVGSFSKGEFAPRLQFADEREAAGYLEVYTKSAATPEVTLEIAARIGGPALARAPMPLQRSREADRWIATGAVPLETIAPGDYVVRAAVKVNGESTEVVRGLRKIAPRGTPLLQEVRDIRFR